VDASFLFRCRNCGRVWAQDYPPCKCGGGRAAFDAEIVACRRDEA